MSSNSTRRPDDESNNNLVDEQVKKLLKDGFKTKIPTNVINELRRKYNDENLMDKIQELFYDRLNEIKSRARKFTKLIEKKFATKGLPLHIVLKESLKYKEKYNLSDVEFDEFKKQYEKLWNERFGNVIDYELMPNTNMAQLFGDVNSNDGLIIKDSDYPIVQDIIKMYSMTRATHSSVILQSMQYENCASEVTFATFDQQKHSIACAIHPLIVAMFFPKIRLLEEHFLFTNLAYIIKSKFNKEPLNNQADYKILYNMINDANDVVCSAETPLKDIRTRFNLQTNLWSNVLALRSGKFFDCGSNDFFTAIDDCKISMYDTPDLLYVGDEGVILKRLLGAFSFRPVILETNPIFGSYGIANPINFPVINNKVISQSILTVRLPFSSITSSSSLVNFSLMNAISHTQIYQENGMSVPKTQEVVWTNGVVIFHVPRRMLSTEIRYKNLINPFQQYEQIPSHILKNEKINSIPVEISESLTIHNLTYYLRSAVYLETKSDDTAEDKTDGSQIILSTGCVVREMNNPLIGNYLWYTPLRLHPTDNIKMNIINRYTDLEITPLEHLSIKGTIFIYSKDYDN